MDATGGTGDKKRAAANFNSWLASLDNRWKERWLGTNGFSLGPKAEVYDAEILGLCGGLEAALTSPMVEVSSGIHICTDNLNVAQKAGTIPNGSSQAGFARFKEAAQQWIRQGRKITVQWVPSQMGIQGNEKADIEAKNNADIIAAAVTEETQTLAHPYRAIRQKKDQAWLNEW